MGKTTAALLLITCALGGYAAAGTYYVDFDGGADANDGLTPQTAWKHSPGDAAATDAVRKARLAPGDTVVFKGGVVYRGSFRAATGAQDAPLTYDGNTAGAFGTGRAIIDGSLPVTGWRRCQSADEAAGSPHWEKLWYAYVPAGSELMSLNLCAGDEMLPVAQHPNLTDTFFNDDLDTFRQAPGRPEVISDVKITPGEGTGTNAARPLVTLADGDFGSSAVLNDIANATVHFELPREATLTAVGVANMANYSKVKGFSFHAGDTEILRGELAADSGIQKFDLPEPVTVRKLTFRSHSMHPAQRTWGAIGEIQAWDADGNNVLRAHTSSALTDPDYFTQSDPHFWDNATFVLHGGANAVHYRRVTGYEPAAGRILFRTFLANTYPQSRFAMMNAPGILDRPGEYVFCEQPDEDGRHRVILWPPAAGPDGPADMTCSRPSKGSRTAAIDVSGVESVIVQGFLIRKVGGNGAAGVSGRNSSRVQIRDNEIALLSASGGGGGVSMSDITHSLIEGNNIHHNRRCAGIVVSRYNDSTVKGNRLHKNGKTALDYYNCRRSNVLGNTVTDHTGVHANGLTFYLGCSDILVEGNRVANGNVCLTAQDGENLTIRNNVFDAGGKSMCIGFWRGKPLTNVSIENNTLLGAKRSSWEGAIFNDNRGGTNFVVRNNIIDGLSGLPLHERSHNIYTHWGPAQEDKKLADGELYVEDMAKLFVDPANDDYRLAPGSPAIDAGTDVGITRDIIGTKVPQGAGPDIGAYEATGGE